MKRYKCAYCDREFEILDEAVLHKSARNGEPVCERSILETE
jgi:DNA-directed RNA polymerase subunit RPC12/RpoP